MRRRGDRLHRGLEAVTVALLAVYFVLVVLQVLFRYVLNRSLFWSEELVRFALIWSVMLGSAVVAYRGEHIRIDVLDGSCRRPAADRDPAGRVPHLRLQPDPARGPACSSWSAR